MSPSADYSPLAFDDQGLIIAASQLGNEEHRARSRIALQERNTRAAAQQEREARARAVRHLRRVEALLRQAPAHLSQAA